MDKEKGDGKKKAVSALSKAFIDSAAEMAEELGLEKAMPAVREAKNQESTHSSDQKMGSKKAKINKEEDDDQDEEIEENREDQDTDEGADENEYTDDGEADTGNKGDEGENDEEDEKKGTDKKVSAAMKKPVKKSRSLVDEMSEDEDVAAAMDVEPFLRKLTKGISDRLDAMQETLQKSSEQDIKKMLRPMAKSITALGDIQSVIFDSIEAIGAQPQKSASLMKSNHDRFYGVSAADAETEKTNPGMETLQKSMDKNRAIALASNIYDGRTMAKIQNRLNKGMDLEPEWIKEILKAAAKEDK